MYVLCGTNMCATEDGRVIERYKLKNHIDEYNVILDTCQFDFSFHAIPKGYYWDAMRFLYCRKQVVQDSNELYIVLPRQFNVFKKSDFHVQEIAYSGSEYSELMPKRGAILIERIVARLCTQLQSQKQSGNWWIYAANHCNTGVRIIAGVGECVMLSRLLLPADNVCDEISRSVIYLKRYGLRKKPTIFSEFLEFDDAFMYLNSADLQCKFGFIGCSDMGMFLMKYAASLRHQPIPFNFKKENDVTRFISSKRGTHCCYALCFMSMVALVMSLYKTQIIHSKLCLKHPVICKSDRATIEIDIPNFADYAADDAQELLHEIISKYRQAELPTIALRKVHEFGVIHGITILAISLENKTVKIKTKIDRKKFEELKIAGVSIDASSEAKFDDNVFEDNTVYEVVVCVNID